MFSYVTLSKVLICYVTSIVPKTKIVKFQKKRAFFRQKLNNLKIIFEKFRLYISFPKMLRPDEIMANPIFVSG